MDTQESELISRALAGEQSAFGVLYAHHAGRAKAYFLRCGFGSADADDLTQTVFVRVFKSLHTFDAARGQFPAWLAAIVRNTARKHLRRRRSPACFDPELAEETLCGGDNPGPASEEREEIDALSECISALPSEPARIINLRYVEGRTTRGIADITGIAEATVRLRLSEAKDMLRRCLKSKGFLD